MAYYTITIQPGTLMSADEFIRLPKEDGWHYELAEGRLVRMPLAGYNHDVVVSRLAARLLPFVEEHNLGECTLSQAGYLLSQRGEPDTVRSPDLAFVSATRIPRPNTPESIAFPRLAPDLVVEAVSPVGAGAVLGGVGDLVSARRGLVERAKMWLSSGVRLVWIIWPQAKQVEVWQPISDTPAAILTITDTLDGLNVVPDFTCPVARLFK